MKPLFKWSGGKTKEFPVIEKYMPKSFDRYIEPFAGGAATWLTLNKDKNIVNDIYTDVYRFYSEIQNDFSIIDDIIKLSTDYNSMYREGMSKQEQADTQGAFYYEWRDGVYTLERDLAIRFYILRQLSFSGMLRFNGSGKFNVPFGWYKRMKDLKWGPEYENLFNNTTFYNTDFESCFKEANENDFIFLDPPYTTIFKKYDPNSSFTNEDHIRLRDNMASTKAKVMIIINSDDFTRGLYGDMIKEEYGYKYSVKFRDRVSQEDSKNLHFVATNY